MDKNNNNNPSNNNDINNIVKKGNELKSPNMFVINQNSKFLLDSLNILKTGDDMDIMGCLINLCEQISLSSDQIGDEPCMPLLLEEICKNLEKTYIIELVIYSLQCINNILDLNPVFTSTLKKVGAIPKMIILMSSLEDFSCLESIIKILEKISFENAHILLENSAFISLLNVIDFLSNLQKKSVMKACLNMIINTSSYSDYNLYIKPSLPIIASLTKFNENDLQTTTSAVTIFYYIISHMKSRNYIKNKPDIDKDILQYCFLDNLCEILERYLITLEEKKIDSELIRKIIKTLEMICHISPESCEKLLKIKILNIIKDLLELEFNCSKNTNYININNSHNLNDNNNEIYTKTQTSFLGEIFSLLIKFFPDKNNNEINLEKDKILSKQCQIEYKYFCENILLLIIQNIMLKSACSTLSSLLKLLIIFATNAEISFIIKYLDSKSLAQIISKLLDTKYLPYLVDIINFLNIIMEKTPDNFIVPFIREGIIENLKSFQFTYPNQQLDNKKNKISNNDSNNNNFISIDDDDNNNNEDIKDREDVYSDDNNINNNEKLSDQIIEDIISSNKESDINSNNNFKSNINIISNNNNNNDNNLKIEKKDNVVIINSNKDKESNNNFIPENKNELKIDNNNITMSFTNNNNNNLNNNNFNNFNNNNFNNNNFNNNNLNNNNINNEVKIIPKNNNNINLLNEENKLNEIMKDFANVNDKLHMILSKTNMKIDEFNLIKSQLENAENDENLLENLEYNSYTTTSSIKRVEAKLKAFVSKYLTDELIANYLAKESNIKEKNLLQIKSKLISLKEDLYNNKDNKEIIKIKLNDILNILTNPENELTLFELESSNILFALCSYFQPNFKELNNLISDEEINNLKRENFVLPENYVKLNEEIFEKTKLFFNILNNDKNKIINYINLLQYTITSMNCFTMIIDDSNNNNLLAFFNQTFKDSKKIEVKIKYSEDIYNETIAKKVIEDKLTDESFIKKLEEYNNAFLLGNKDIRLLISHKSCLDDLNSLLLSNSGVSFSSNDKYEVSLIYRVEKLDKDNKKVIFDIDNKWKYKDIVDELIKKYNLTQKEAKGILLSQYKFGVSYKEKKLNKDDKENKDNSKNNNDTNNNNLIEDNIEDSFKILGWNKSVNDCIDINQIIFEKFYHCNIIFNKNLYEIKRLMPSLFLLSLIYFPIIEFSELFDIPQNLFTLEELKNLFINSKVTLLITKACRDGYSISRNSLPSWCTNLSMEFNYLTKFNSRHLLFKVSFDPRRSLVNLQNYLKSYQTKISNENQIIVGKSMRLKVIAERDKILETAFKLLNDPVTSEFGGYLEFEYQNEIGNGIGPTLEFYSLVIDKLQQDNNLWYKTTDRSLYPNIFNKNDPEFNNYLVKFQLLGFIIARALYDDRLIDIPISKLFWDMILDRAIPLKKISIIDKDLGKVINDLNEIIIKKKIFIQEYQNKNKNIIIDNNHLVKELNKNILYNNKPLDYMDLYFTFPGNENIELKKGGQDIKLTIENVDEYVTLIYNKLFYSGMKEIINSFLKGFQTVLNIESIKVFNSEEIEESICGSLENKWDYDVLYEFIVTEHGIIKDSRLFKDLIKFMCSLDKNQQKKFLTFVTGTSRLPVGGFKSLTPRLTVVKRTCNEYENPDVFLPTVMTCQNYLKLPEYSSYQILHEKITIAMNEGTNEFHLS